MYAYLIKIIIIIEISNKKLRNLLNNMIHIYVQSTMANIFNTFFFSNLLINALPMGCISFEYPDDQNIHMHTQQIQTEEIMPFLINLFSEMYTRLVYIYIHSSFPGI